MEFERISTVEIATDKLVRREGPSGQRASTDAPAVKLLTDLVRLIPATTHPSRPLDEALAHMIRLGVRSLLVRRHGAV